MGLARGLATKPASCFRLSPTCVLMDQATGDEQVIQVDNGQAIKIGVGMETINCHMKGSNLLLTVHLTAHMYVVSVQFILRYLCYRTAELMKKLPKVYTKPLCGLWL